MSVKPTGFGMLKQAELNHFADASEQGFVANRISVIRENTDVTQCKFIRTKQNPSSIKRGECQHID